MAKITVHGVREDARMTAGAIMDAKEHLGFDPLFAHERLDTEALTVLAWCSARRTARCDGRGFDMSLDEFADSVTLRDINAWFVAENPPGGEEDALAPAKKD